jgi:hypothetical protein
MAETKAIAELAFGAFIESYTLKYEKAADYWRFTTFLPSTGNTAHHQPHRKYLRHRAPPHDPI